MKKTLIAMAVLAASGASFAQVTVTGNYAAGYRATTSVASATATTAKDQSGLGIDGSNINFTATEDLGGGMAAGANLGFDGVNRASVAGADSGLFLSGGFGKVSLSTGRGSEYLSGGIAGVGGVGWDGKIFGQNLTSDAIGYTLPKFGDFTVGFSHSEGATSPQGANETTNPIGLGVGATGDAIAQGYQRNNNLSLSYSSGPLNANVSMNAWDQSGTTTTNAGNGKTRTSASVNYDLGVVKLGAGVRVSQLVVGSRTDSLLAISAPIGSSFVLGANWGSRSQADGTSADGTKTGTSLKGVYSLSKRTSMIASYARWDQNVGQFTSSSEMNLLVNHSF